MYGTFDNVLHDENVNAIVSLLCDPDAGTREEAARILAGSGNKSVAQLLTGYICSADVGLCGLAGEVLVKMGPVAVEAVASIMDSPSGTLRKIAVDLLALMPAQEVAPRIAELLDDPDNNVRLAAIDALGSLGSCEYADRIRSLYDTDPTARPHILEVIGRLGCQDDLNLLERALEDEDPVVQLCAVEVLSNHGTPDVAPLLLKKLDTIDPMAHPVVLRTVVELFEKYPESAITSNERFRDELIRMLDDPDPDYRRTAGRGLRFYNDHAAIEALLSHAGKDDANDVIALGLLSQRADALDILSGCRTNGVMTPSPAVTFVLGLLARGVLPEEQVGNASTFIIDCFSELDADIKMAALNLSHRLALPDLQTILEAGLSDPDPTVSSFAEDLLDLISQSR